MLLYPAIDDLKTKVDSKYTLAILTAKRARDIIDGKPMLTINETNKPLSVATSEVDEDLISYKAPEESEADGDFAEEEETEAEEEFVSEETEEDEPELFAETDEDADEESEEETETE